MRPAVPPRRVLRRPPALEEDPALLDYAFGKRVALASPVNLWAVLKTVAYRGRDVSEGGLDVDSGNVTGALRLYEGLGFATTRTSVSWELALPPVAGTTPR